MKRFRFRDGWFTFWMVPADERRVALFRVREDRTPVERAIEKGYPRGIPIQPAPSELIWVWFVTHPDYPVLEESTEAPVK